MTPDIDAMVAAEIRDAATRTRRRAQIDSCPAYDPVAETLEAMARAIEQGATDSGPARELLELVGRVDELMASRGAMTAGTWDMVARALRAIAACLSRPETA